MHISIDSALGRQRRLNQIGETINSIATSAAAYSLRSLTGGDPKVVRVRRESDNTERDFTVSEVNSGDMVNFVNTQTVKPLDVRALESDGDRDGNFQIASAAYSLRSLGDRQATIPNDAAPLNADTVVPASGKYVVQVRRSSDDTIKSFTADEVTDGTLVSFVGSGNDGFVRTWYDQSVTDQGGGTATGNHAVQATAAEQPKIVSSGALILQDSKPTINFDTSSKTFGFSSSLALSTTFSYFNVFNPEADAKVLHAGSAPRIDFENSDPDEVEIVSNSFGGSTKMNLSKNGFLSSQNLFSLINVSTAVSVFDGGTASSENPNTVSGSFTFTTLGGGAVQNHQELIVYATDQTDNRGAY